MQQRRPDIAIGIARSCRLTPLTDGTRKTTGESCATMICCNDTLCIVRLAAWPPVPVRRRRSRPPHCVDPPRTCAHASRLEPVPILYYRTKAYVVLVTLDVVSYRVKHGVGSHFAPLRPGTLANNVFLHCCVGLPRALPRVAREALLAVARRMSGRPPPRRFHCLSRVHPPPSDGSARLTLDSRACTPSSAHRSCCAADRRGVARSNAWGAAAMRGGHRYIAAGHQLARCAPMSARHTVSTEWAARAMHFCGGWSGCASGIFHRWL